MSKLFNAQNGGGSSQFSSKEFLIYFTDINGTYSIYRYNSTTQAHRLVTNPSELLKAKRIYVSYSYLGGIHLSNYSVNKAIAGSQTIFTFSLNKVSYSQDSVNQYWDLPNAVFINRLPSHNRGFEAVANFTITFSNNILVSTAFCTFGDLCLSREGRAFSTDFYSDNGVLNLATHDLLINQNIEQGATALNRLEQDVISSNPLYLSNRAGYWIIDQLVSHFALSAVFFGYAKIETVWYKRLYFVALGANQFMIDEEPGNHAMASIIEMRVGSTNIDYGAFFNDMAFDYYQLEEE